MHLGGVDPPLGDPGVDPLAVHVHPRASGPSRPPFGAFLVAEVAAHRLPRQAEVSGDLTDRNALPAEFMDPLEPPDAPPSLRQRGLLSRRRRSWGRRRFLG